MIEFEFVPAGMETLYPYLVSFLGRDACKKVCKTVLRTGLLSFGGELKRGKPLPDAKTYLDALYKNKLSTCKTFVEDGGYLFIDSGGYQVITGYVLKEDLPKFVDTYAQFLNDYRDSYSFAFSLDIPEFGGSAKRDEILALNRLSLSMMDNLDKDVKDRVYFIAHFNSSEVYKVWNTLIFEDKHIRKFSKFSIGGLVSSRPSTKLMRYTLLILGLLQILVGLDYKLPNPFYFHILGSTIPRNILFYALVKEHIEHLFNVKAVFTYDSSVVFKKVALSRAFTYYDRETLSSYSVSLKSKELDDLHPVIRRKNIDIVMDTVREMIEYIGLDLDEYMPDRVYDKWNATIDDKMKPWTLLIECYTLKRVSEDSLKLAKELYKYYKPYSDNTDFYSVVYDKFMKLNEKQYSDICEEYCSSVITSLDCIYDFVYNRKQPSELESFLSNFDTVLDVSTNDATKGLDLPF